MQGDLIDCTRNGQLDFGLPIMNFMSGVFFWSYVVKLAKVLVVSCN